MTSPSIVRSIALCIEVKSLWIVCRSRTVADQMKCASHKWLTRTAGQGESRSETGGDHRVIVRVLKDGRTELERCHESETLSRPL